MLLGAPTRYYAPRFYHFLKMQGREVTDQIYRDIAKLLEFGVSEELIKEMTPEQIKGLLNGVIYLKTRYKEKESSQLPISSEALFP